MIEQVRHFLGVLGVVGFPPGLLFWFVIHPWARWWRRLGPIRTYLVVLPVLVALGALLFRVRRFLLGTDLGTNRVLIGISVVLYCVMIPLEFRFRYWKHLKTLVGLTELLSTGQQEGKLLQDGAYRVVRHPRYLSAGIGVIANSLIINYVGMYVLILLLFPLGYFMLLLEERELVDRFGDAYRQYQREVPQLIPRFRRGVR